MITKTINNVTMELEAKCLWGLLCDVAIIQRWDHPQSGHSQAFIEMNISEAEQLIVEIQAAIDEAKRLDDEYRASH